jgi:UDP-N-acetylglucosamine 2-epimerase (non-hydrolysing)
LAVEGAGDFRLIEPVGYLDMLGLVAGARLVITDSGGLQEETTFLGVPCLTVRPTTERPITCTHGTNRLVPPNRDAILAAAERAVARQVPVRPNLERWDGRSAERIARVLCEGEQFGAQAPDAAFAVQTSDAAPGDALFASDTEAVALRRARMFSIKEVPT